MFLLSVCDTVIVVSDSASPDASLLSFMQTAVQLQQCLRGQEEVGKVTLQSNGISFSIPKVTDIAQPRSCVDVKSLTFRRCEFYLPDL